MNGSSSIITLRRAQTSVDSFSLTGTCVRGQVTIAARIVKGRFLDCGALQPGGERSGSAVEGCATPEVSTGIIARTEGVDIHFFWLVFDIQVCLVMGRGCVGIRPLHLAGREISLDEEVNWSPKAFAEMLGNSEDAAFAEAHFG